MPRPRVCLSPGAHVRERLLGSGSGVHSPCPRVGIWSFLHQVSPSKANTWPVASFLYSTYCPPQPGILIILGPVSPGTFDKSVQNKCRLPKGLQSYSFWFYIYINQINSFWAEIYTYFTITITASRGSFHFLLWFIQVYLFASRKSKKIVSQNIREVEAIVQNQVAWVPISWQHYWVFIVSHPPPPSPPPAPALLSRWSVI